MKHFALLSVSVLFAVLLLIPASFAVGEEAAALPISVRREEAWGPVDDLNGKEADSYVFYPVFETADEALLPAIEKMNAAIQEKARIPEYTRLVSTIAPGGTGLKMDYALGLTRDYVDGNGPRISDWYVSILFSAEGKMLQGRPSHVYYPMTFDMRTGEEVSFDQLFTDPDGARAFIEEYLEAEIEPTLSTYLENSQLFPVPYERFFLDAYGHVILVYENSQLSFLSGVSGAVSLRYSQLEPWLDETEEGVVSHLPWLSFHDAQSTDGLWNWLKCDALILSDGPALTLGTKMDEVWQSFHAAADSEFYPGGACYELEEPVYRGALMITDENEETVTGVQTCEWDFGAIQTGKTALSDAISFLEKEPDAIIPLDDTAAAFYRVCPGLAYIYTLADYSGKALTFTFYADQDDVVQYVKLSLD
ncbi:MAG: hypothetical protein IKQ41_10015 [Clostridia bacterium]|nr:hypothetical protein [Clostridia bacterium]